MSIDFDVANGRAVDLGMGYRLIAPGYRGTGRALEPSDFQVGTRSGQRSTNFINPTFAGALARAEMREEQTITVDLREDPAGRPTRSAAHGEGMILVSPDMGDKWGQVAIVTDESGAVSFHFPVEDEQDQTPQPATTRGRGGEKVFVLRSHIPPSPPVSESATRGLVGLIGQKLIQVVAFPLAELVGATVGEHFVRRWERTNRPNQVRPFTPQERKIPTAEEMSDADWSAMAAGRALLFVHGTFSTAHGGFSGIPDALFARLYQTYEGRVFAYNHHSLSMDPAENVEWFLSRIPSGIGLDVDIICHSRGGLVARTMAGELPDLGSDLSPIIVGKIVFVATPNNGTALADEDNVVGFLDRIATMANLLPVPPVVEALDAVLVVVKTIAYGMLTGLSGLAAMRPGGEFLGRLNGGPKVATEYYALAANYEPTNPGLKALVAGAKDAAVDAVFGGKPNDLVVPTVGVYRGEADANFPIPTDNLFEFPADRGISHSTYWAEPETSERFLSWLTG
jgi:pimeloyl-ACP methyl ester carboxylesterase